MALQMERRLAGENVFAGGFFLLFFLLCGERQRLEDREGKIIQIEKYGAGK